MTAKDTSELRESSMVGRRRRDAVVVAGFLLILVAPSLSFLAGMRTENRENRPLASFPALSLASLGQVDTYAAIDRFGADRFPFRAAAASLDATGRYLLRTSANPDVMIGSDGWLFSRDSLQANCAVSPETMAAEVDRVAGRLMEANIALHIVIVPDKQAIYPEMRPGGVRPCADAARPAMQMAFAARSETTLDLWEHLRAAARTKEDLLFWPKDTHWSPAGGLIGVRALVNHIDPAVWDESAVHRGGTTTRIGDLSNLMGMPTEERSAAVRIERANEVAQTLLPTPVVAPPGRELRLFRSTGPATTIEGSTLIIHDSGFGVHANLIAPWFESSTWLHVNVLLEHPEIARDLPPFDRVIVERVERFAYGLRLDAALAPVLDAAQRQSRGAGGAADALQPGP